MDIEQLRNYCLSKPEAEEYFPFGQETPVYRVRNQMFLLTSFSNQPLQFNVKCDPEKALELREAYPCILPGYHMNKRHWNTVIIDGSLSMQQLREFIDDSYNLVKGRK